MASRWHTCAHCDGAAEYAIVGNRLLSQRDVKRLSAERPPVFSWRCQEHEGYTMRAASAVRATQEGDLVFTLVCGHEVCWVFRGRGAYTPARIERAITTRLLRLDQLQRCYACGDLEQESERKR